MSSPEVSRSPVAKPMLDEDMRWMQGDTLSADFKGNGRQEDGIACCASAKALYRAGCPGSPVFRRAGSACAKGGFRSVSIAPVSKVKQRCLPSTTTSATGLELWKSMFVRSSQIHRVDWKSDRIVLFKCIAVSSIASRTGRPMIHAFPAGDVSMARLDQKQPGTERSEDATRR